VSGSNQVASMTKELIKSLNLSEEELRTFRLNDYFNKDKETISSS